MIRKQSLNHNQQFKNNLKHTVMTLSEFENSLYSFMANEKYNETTDLLLDLDGCKDITLNDANEYNCTLGNVISTLDKMGVYHELKGLGSNSGMFIHIPICK